MSKCPAKKRKLKNIEWVVAGKPTCPPTVRAVRVVADLTDDYLFINIDPNNSRTACNREIYQKELGFKVPKTWKTVPQVFHNGKFIGGYTDLIDFLEKNDNVVCRMSTKSSSKNYEKDSEILQKRSGDLREAPGDEDESELELEEDEDEEEMDSPYSYHLSLHSLLSKE